MRDQGSGPADGDNGLDPSPQRSAVRERYGSIAGGSTSESCCGDSPGCCGDDAAAGGTSVTELGYDEADVPGLEAGGELGLGCGNPTAIASLAAGETVLDLGSGGGFDRFLAAREVGPEGRVIGVDMTPEMVERARENRVANDATTVEFRLGEIEHLPVADASVDVVISNCVVNLSPAKSQVFSEASRVLRQGGRLAISDVVRTGDLPALEDDPASIAGCVDGAEGIGRIREMLLAAGFTDLAIEPKDESESFIRGWDADRDLSESLVAASIEAEKPAGSGGD
ncbi:MAG: arsenite methyltransferase [Haloarculaceae archaeon]